MRRQYFSDPQKTNRLNHITHHCFDVHCSMSFLCFFDCKRNHCKYCYGAETVDRRDDLFCVKKEEIAKIRMIDSFISVTSV